MIEKISHKDIPDSLLKEAGKDKFSLYPIEFNGVLFHHYRWKGIDETKVSFWAVIKEGVIQSVLEFYLNDYDMLAAKIRDLRGSKKKIFLLGVSFALLDVAEQFELDMQECIVMETGGMKGRRQELTREEFDSMDPGKEVEESELKEDGDSASLIPKKKPTDIHPPEPLQLKT